MELDKERIELALKLVKVAEADVQSAEASLAEAKAILAKYQAEVDRWDSEVKRLTIEVKTGRGRPPDPPRVDQPVEVEHRGAERGEGDDHEGGGGTALQTGDAREGEGRRLGRPRRPGRRHERGEAARGLGGLPHAHRALRRRDRGPQRQHLRLRPARHGRPHGDVAFPLPVARRNRRADLRGRPHRRGPDLRRHSRAGRQLRPHRDEGDRAGQGITATSRSRAPSRARPGR